MPNVHRAALAGYSAKADIYAAGRPDYPAAIEGWLRSEIGLAAGRSVLDLGAGTGKFTPYLLATGAAVIAVEPVPAMLAHLARQYPEVAAKAGSADHIPLADAVVDAVVCAQSFHWFATAEALREIYRVLRPGGALGLVWNVRDSRVPWVAALDRIMDRREGDTPRFHTQNWRRAFPADGFTPLEERRFPHGHTGAPEQVVVDRVLSTSFIAALPPAEQDRIAAEARAIIAATPELAGRDIVTFPYETRAFSCRKLA